MATFMGLPVRWRIIATKKLDGGVTEQWQATVSYRDVNGKKRRKTKLYPSDTNLTTDRQKGIAARKWLKSLDDEQERAKEEARHKAEESARIAEAKADPYANVTVGEYVSRFVEGLASAGDIERSTAKSYRGAARHVESGFDGVLLRDLTPAMVKDWRDSLLLEGYANGSVTKWLRVLSESLKEAAAMKVIPENPCSVVRAPKRKAPEPNSLTPEGYARLARTLDMLNPSPVVVAASIAMHCGLRVGEICGIRWREYNPGARIIHVCEAIGNDGSGKDYTKKPKTLAGVRDVPVPAILADMLDRRKGAMIEDLQEAGITLDASEFGELYVIGSAHTGRFASPTIIERQFKGLAESFCLVGSRGRRMTMHGLRDSYATLAIAANADVRSVAGVLGHSNPSITLSVYADALPEGKRRASDLLTATIEAQGDVRPYAAAADVPSLSEVWQ